MLLLLLHWPALLAALGGDPSTTWEAYAIYTPVTTTTAGAQPNVTLVSASYEVPEPPLDDDGTTPKWWVGLQSADGMGVLLKPQLTWQNATWVINTEVLDYSKVPSFKSLSAPLVVQPGQRIDASVRETGRAGTGEYTLAIGPSARAGEGATAGVSSQVYAVGVAETRAYAVMEHQPANCWALPRAGEFVMRGVGVEVAGAPADPSLWVARSHLPVCNAHATVSGSDGVIRFRWRVGVGVGVHR